VGEGVDLQSQRNQVGVHAEAKETGRGFGGPQARAVGVKAAKISCCEFARVGSPRNR